VKDQSERRGFVGPMFDETLFRPRPQGNHAGDRECAYNFGGNGSHLKDDVNWFVSEGQSQRAFPETSTLLLSLGARSFREPYTSRCASNDENGIIQKHEFSWED
jgi:hypothetical protein